MPASRYFSSALNVGLTGLGFDVATGAGLAVGAGGWAVGAGCDGRAVTAGSGLAGVVGVAVGTPASPDGDGTGWTGPD